MGIKVLSRKSHIFFCSCYLTECAHSIDKIVLTYGSPSLMLMSEKHRTEYDILNQIKQSV